MGAMNWQPKRQYVLGNFNRSSISLLVILHMFFGLEWWNSFYIMLTLIYRPKM
jgi:hypothetical protein